MTEGVAGIANRVLTILEQILPAWLLAVVLVGLCVLATVAVMLRNRTSVIVAPTDPYAGYRSPEVQVSVANSTGPFSDAIAASAGPGGDMPKGRRRKELNRIAALPADEDEDFWTS